MSIGARVPMARLRPPPAPHQQPLLAVEPEQALVVHHIALPAQQDVQPPVAEPPALMAKRLHPLAQHRIVRPPRAGSASSSRQQPITVHARRSLIPNASVR